MRMVPHRVPGTRPHLVRDDIYVLRTTTTTTTTMKPPYNPHLIPRKVRYIHQDGPVAVFATKSFTDTSSPSVTTYKPRINIITGYCTCDCGDWRYRKSTGNPDIFFPDPQLCKHLVRAKSNLIRNGQMPLKHCSNCSCVLEPSTPCERVSDPFGNPMPGSYICTECVSFLQEQAHHKPR